MEDLTLEQREDLLEIQKKREDRKLDMLKAEIRLRENPIIYQRVIGSDGDKSTWENLGVNGHRVEKGYGVPMKQFLEMDEKRIKFGLGYGLYYEWSKNSVLCNKCNKEYTRYCSEYDLCNKCRMSR